MDISVSYSLAGLATDWTIRVQFRAEERTFSLLRSVQTDSVAHLASYAMGST
jgi:hypothetical protein